MKSMSRRAPIHAVMGLMCLFALANCSASGDDGRTVEAGPLLCQLSADAGSISDVVFVTCKVTVQNSSVNSEGLDVSVTNILQVDVLRDVCPQFSRAEVEVNSEGFAKQVQTGLSYEYQVSGSGWTISSVSCTFTGT